jgi:hypothetical protein
MGREAGIWGRVTTYSSVDFFTSPRTHSDTLLKQYNAAESTAVLLASDGAQSELEWILELEQMFVIKILIMDCQTKGRCAPSKRTH